MRLDINWRLVTQGVLLCLFTCIRTATPSTFFFTLPFIADCLPSFPPISVVSAVVSTVRLASTALVALYPKECLELLAVLSLCASLFGVCSDFYVNIAPEYQGYYVFAASIFIFFCSGSSIARALIVTEDSRGDLEKMSNVYTCAKESVFIVSFVLSAIVITHGCWTGFGIWVAASYGLIFVMCAFILLARRRSLFVGSLFRMSDSYESLDGCSGEDEEEEMGKEGGDLRDISGGKSTNIIINFFQVTSLSILHSLSILYCASSHDWRRRPYNDEFKHVFQVGSLFRMSDSYESLDGCSGEDEEEEMGKEGGDLRDISGGKSTNIIINFFQDIRSIQKPLWFFVQFAEAIGVVSGIVSLSAVMLVKDKWQLTRVETSLFTLLPMALTLPAFLLTTFIPCNLYVKLLIGMFVPTLVAIMPFVHNLYAMGFIIFSCELANSMRLAAMTPILNSFMNGKQTTIRLVSVVTLLSFVYKTIGLSLGAYLFTIWEPFPFIAAGLFQVTNAMGILSLKPYIDHQMSKESAMERKTLLDHH
ncbi:uncharacterized protein LOC142336638 [Convolutriloba macropyga]|uniref:uncharacterized protein LOC142336638 n=1 Tax=Convolutriloba macropyga TaxID=536237 RepID=UPI003F527809